MRAFKTAFNCSKLVGLAMACWCLMLEGASATSFTYNDDMTCKSPASITVASLSCGENSSVCSFGDELKASGEVVLTEDIPETVCVELSNCFMGLSFICKTIQQDNVNLCEEMNLSSDDSQCPSAGSYSFESNLKIPGTEDRSLGSGWWVTSTVTLKDCDSGSKFTSCKLSFKAVNNSGNSGSASAALFNVSAIGLVAALGVLYHQHRNRSMAQIDLGREELLADSKQENIEMMCGQRSFVQV